MSAESRRSPTGTSTSAPPASAFNAVRGSTRTPAALDSVNSAFFADDIFGTPFGSNTLAVANTFFFILEGTNQTIEADVIFNNAKGFNCYRGSRASPTPETFNTADLKRVALHEFGHVVGLDHPDEAVPPQDVNAIMNSINSDTDRAAARRYPGRAHVI